jgi:hypothetical protein
MVNPPSTRFNHRSARFNHRSARFNQWSTRFNQWSTHRQLDSTTVQPVVNHRPTVNSIDFNQCLTEWLVLLRLEDRRDAWVAHHSMQPYSTHGQPQFNPSSTHRQPQFNPSSTHRQPIVNPSSTHRQPIVNQQEGEGARGCEHDR